MFLGAFVLIVILAAATLVIVGYLVVLQRWHAEDHPELFRECPKCGRRNPAGAPCRDCGYAPRPDPEAGGSLTGYEHGDGFRVVWDAPGRGRMVR